jgi:hypothetical protein
MGNSSNHRSNFCGRTRREFLWETGCGFGAAALTSLLAGDGFFPRAYASSAAPANPLAPKPAPLAAKAKSVIFLFMYGGPSHIDTFDYKPAMIGMDGKTLDVKTFGRGGHKNQGRIVEPRWQFHQHGQCGKWVSTLFPHLATCVDDIAFLHSMTAESPIHGSAMLMMNSGRILSGSPALGSWVNYGLGSVNQNLPGFVVMLDRKGGPISGAKNWSSGYMPATYAGTVFNVEGSPIHDLALPEGTTRPVRREVLDTLARMNERHRAAHADHSELAARIASYELAFKMQEHAPEAVDLSQETKATRELYGLDKDATRDFGTRCLLARRLVERGVRFIQVYSGGAHNDDNWDAHGDLVENHTLHAGATDQPIAGLLKDLKQRGLLAASSGASPRRSTPSARAATIILTASRCGLPAAASRAASASAAPTSLARPPPTNHFTSSGCTPRSCTNWGSIQTACRISSEGWIKNSSASRLWNQFTRLWRESRNRFRTPSPLGGGPGRGSNRLASGRF